MHLMKLKLLYLLVIAGFYSCSNESPKPTSTWLGGEIVNPYSDYIVLEKDDIIIDTIRLDENNFFLYKIDSVEAGLYSFNHKEFQLIFIEPGDSIMFRVNTIEFDESLAFSGIGSEKNNFLINRFLQNEAENKLIPKYYKLSPELFIEKIDSLHLEKEVAFTRLKQKHVLTTEYIEFGQASIDYYYFSKKEIYPLAHYGRNKLLEIENLPNDFFNYRSKINFTNDNFNSFYLYEMFLNKYFDNISYNQYLKDSPYNMNSYLHNAIKLKLIDSIVSNTELKNKLTFNASKDYLISAEDYTKSNDILSLFLEYNTNQYQQESIKNLVKYCEKMIPGNSLPNQLLGTSDKTIKDLHSVFRKPTVLFFWSLRLKRHYKNLHVKADELRLKYPEIDFIAINIDESQEKWLNEISNRSYNTKYEYRFDDTKLARKSLIINSINKAIIVDEKGVIINNNTNLFGTKFEEQLLGFLNK